MTNKPDFLQVFYRQFIYCGFAGSLLALIFAGVRPGYSIFLGFISIGIILFCWDRITARTLRPRQASLMWETLMVFLRYILLGGLFYAMIRLFVVSWGWYAAGVSTLLPALLLALLFFDEDPKASE